MLTSKSNKVNTQKLESKPRVQTQMYDDSIGTTTYCMIICMKSRLTSFSYDSVIEGCISVKCQLMTVNFVGFGCQPGFRLHTSRQSFEPSYTRIQALLVFFLSFALASQPFDSFTLKTNLIVKGLSGSLCHYRTIMYVRRVVSAYKFLEGVD